MLAFGSDYPVEPFAPLAGIYAAMMRTTLKGEPEEGWNRHESLSLDEALRGYTWGAAWGENTDSWKGVLMPGHVCDVAVLDREISDLEPKELLYTRVDLTIVDGRVVYDRKRDKR